MTDTGLAAEAHGLPQPHGCFFASRARQCPSGLPQAASAPKEPARVANPSNGRTHMAEPSSTVADVYAELRVALLAFLRKHTGDAQVAEDLLHDVLVKALMAVRDEAHAPRNLTGWLYAVARNAAMDHHRRQRPMDELPQDLASPLVDHEDAAVIDLANCLRPVAERLPQTYRATVIAAELDGVALARVADDLGLSLSAVKTRASRGRRLLQQELIECCRVSLSSHGQVLDYDAVEAAKCAPTAGRCDKPCEAGRDVH
jgi:RNA polymerase sigma-70 factor (ECF subfamily)